MLASIQLFFAVVGRVLPSLAGRLAASLFVRPRRHPRPERERALIARGKPVALPNGLSANEWGAGPPILLVHGWEGRGAQLGAFVDPFVEAGYRVVALDGPAHGDSQGRTTNGPEFADAIRTARDVVGPLAGVVSHSFGGFTSLLAISRGLTTDRLVVIAAPSSVAEVLAQFSDTIALPPRARPALQHELEAQVHAPMSSFEIEQFADSISVPTLIVHDTDDREVSYSHGPKLAELLGARLLTTNGRGHRRVLFAPEVLTAVVEFIEEGRRATTGAPTVAEQQ
jgi:pimeloyl-ACP methyl ester carboxylesterase